MHLCRIQFVNPIKRARKLATQQLEAVYSKINGQYIHANAFELETGTKLKNLDPEILIAVLSECTN